MALRKLLVAHILGSPLGGAVAARRLRGQAAGSQPSPWETTFSVRYRPGKAQATKGCQAVSLASFQAAAYKVKGKGKVETFL